MRKKNACANFLSDEERYRYRDYAERGYGGERHRERASREKEDRHRDRRHREKEEGRHKSSRRYGPSPAHAAPLISSSSQKDPESLHVNGSLPPPSRL